jgi:A/G-specific adenine glycosylase
MSDSSPPSHLCPALLTLSLAEIRHIRRTLIRWGRANYQDFPWRRADAGWHGLIAEVLLQRTRAAAVVPVYEAFVKRYPTPVLLAVAPIEELEQLLFPLGLRWRVPRLRELGRALAAAGGSVPRCREKLMRLPLVGEYAAAAWLSLHAGKRAVIVDANVVRWLCRLTGQVYDGETRRKRWLLTLADSLTPRTGVRRYNLSVLDFTMKVCTARPSCPSCPFAAGGCVFARKEAEVAVRVA